MTARLRKELVLAAILVGFGLLLLPVVIYIVGVRIVGDYAGEDGALGLTFAVWGALLRGEWAAWVVVLSPYVVIQLVRATIKIMRWRPGVTPVTD